MLRVRCTGWFRKVRGDASTLARILGHQFELFLRCLGHQDGELFTPETSQDILARYHSLENPGEMLQDLVSEGVAETVVDALEMIQVAEQDADRLLRAAGSFHQAGEGVLEIAAVVESGERIMVGSAFQLFQGLFRLSMFSGRQKALLLDLQGQPYQLILRLGHQFFRIGQVVGTGREERGTGVDALFGLVKESLARTFLPLEDHPGQVQEAGQGVCFCGSTKAIADGRRHCQGVHEERALASGFRQFLHGRMMRRAAAMCIGGSFQFSIKRTPISM